MKALVIAERLDSIRELCAGARTKADEVVAIGFGEVPESVADRVVKIAIPEGAVLDDAAETVISIFDAEAPGMVLGEPTRHMKTILGRLAAHAGTSVITDVMEFTGEGARQMYFGGIGERIVTSDADTTICTVTPGVFAEAAAFGANDTSDAAWVTPAQPLKLISSVPMEKSSVDLFKADVVVAAGRGFGEESQLGLARDLCDKLGAGLACSRPLTEGVNWFPSEMYVGVSGLMLAPKAYVAVGISGQMQHMVGCNRSAKIFAINKDRNAPVFGQCDYGLVGDIADVLPALTAAL